jgi:integrase
MTKGIRINQTFVEHHSTSLRETIYWDESLPGFGLRVRRSGHKAYVVQYRKSRRTPRITIGPTTRLKADEARRRARELLAEVSLGGDPAAERDGERAQPTMAELAERYIQVHAIPKKRPSSARSDASNLANHVLPRLGTRTVVDVTRADIANLHYEMRDTPGAANRVLALISKMMNLAESWGIRQDGSNPCRHVERYPERKLERFLSNEELFRLGQALHEAERHQIEMPVVVAAIRLLLFTGARLSEVLNLRWEQVDFERSLANLSESKTGKKVIFLSPPALEIIESRRGTSDTWILEGREAGKALVNLRKPWHRIRAAAGLGDVRLHDLRHSFASVGAAGGFSLPIIGGLLGHKHPATTARYAHLAADPLRQANDLIGSRIRAALEPLLVEPTQHRERLQKGTHGLEDRDSKRAS